MLLAREKTDLSQSLFAKGSHIVVSRLRDWKRTRFNPDRVAATYIKTILTNPKAVERALAGRGRED